MINYSSLILNDFGLTTGGRFMCVTSPLYVNAHNPKLSPSVEQNLRTKNWISLPETFRHVLP